MKIRRARTAKLARRLGAPSQLARQAPNPIPTPTHPHVTPSFLAQSARPNFGLAAVRALGGVERRTAATLRCAYSATFGPCSPATNSKLHLVSGESACKVVQQRGNSLAPKGKRQERQLELKFFLCMFTDKVRAPVGLRYRGHVQNRMAKPPFRVVPRPINGESGHVRPRSSESTSPRPLAHHDLIVHNLLRQRKGQLNSEKYEKKKEK